MTSGAPERMGAMTGSSRACVREGCKRGISRHVHVDHLKELSDFFLTIRVMEDDLVLNLATDNVGPSSTKAAHVSRGGKWTDR